MRTQRGAAEQLSLDDSSSRGPDQPGAGEITLLPPKDVFKTVRAQKTPVTVTMLDPWYNKGFGGARPDYDDWLASLIEAAAVVSDHVFVWGFPEIIALQIPRLPVSTKLVAWLTWYFKNCPSVIRGWRSAQMTCLHISKPDAKMYPEHFLNEAQKELQRNKKLRYMPGPPSVIDAPLNIGFVGRNEQVGHPSQKPEKVFEPLFEMTTKQGDTVLDPMCGSGTTGAVCRKMGRRAILCDESEEYVKMVEKRLGIHRSKR
jgi:site-specific DNA-methyltransferase (adenine-specific)